MVLTGPSTKGKVRANHEMSLHAGPFDGSRAGSCCIPRALQDPAHVPYSADDDAAQHSVKFREQHDARRVQRAKAFSQASLDSREL